MVPKGLKLLRALLVGGGASGWDEVGGGGGGGYVVCGNITLSNESIVSVTVGAGGSIRPSSGISLITHVINTCNSYKYYMYGLVRYIRVLMEHFLLFYVWQEAVPRLEQICRRWEATIP